MKLLKLLITVLILFQVSIANAINCRDYLGGAKSESAILQTHPNDWCFGLFSTTFGDSKPLAQKLLGRGVPPGRIHGLWSDTHSFGDKDIAALTKDAKRWEPVCAKYKGLEYSPFCEHNVPNPDKYLDIAKANAPSCVIVNTPWKGGASSKYKNETHNLDGPIPAGNFNVSWDGKPIVDTDVTKYKAKFKKADKIFFWDCRDNGRWECNDTTPRPQRKGWLDAKLNRSILALAVDKGETKLPPECRKDKVTKKVVCDLPTKWIYKSHSENKGTGDPRAEKPVIIAPVKSNSLKVGSTDCKYYGPYDSGRWRYYCPKWGFEIATSPVKIGKYGTINPAFRDGSYR